MLPITSSKVGVSVGGCMWVEDSYITECTSPEPFMSTSSLAPSCLLEEADSPESGCRSGSTLTSWHTSVKRPAVMSLISLCLSMGNPPLAQERACSMVRNHTWQVGGSVASHTTSKMLVSHIALIERVKFI